jgi:hypothetical protein
MFLITTLEVTMKTFVLACFSIGLLLLGSAVAYELNLDVTSLQLTPTSISQLSGYETATLRGGSYLPAAPGSPSLPGKTVLLAIPAGMEIESVTVNHAEPVILPGYHRIMPAQNPTPISKAAVLVNANPEAYESIASFPGNLVGSFSTGGLGGYAIGSITFAPVQYTPKTGQVLFYRNIEFTVNLKSSPVASVYPGRRLDWIANRIESSVRSAVINPDEVSPPPVITLDEEHIGGNTYPYLIITNSAQTTSANKLADWKTRKGYITKVMTVEEILANYTGADNAEKVRNCVLDYYTNYATQYVLLIGSGTSIPMRYCYDPSFDTEEGNHLVPTDNYYACLEGNWNGDSDGYWGEPTDNVDLGYDVCVGRIQTDAEAQLAPVVEKILCYEGTALAAETNPYDYQGKALLTGGWLDSSTNELLMMTGIQSNYLTDPSYMVTVQGDASYPGGSGFNSAGMITALNAGPGIVVHSMHANNNIMATNSGYVYNTDLAALTNHPRYAGFLNTIGCYDANIDYPTNCAASYVNNANGGGVAFVGNTRYGWYMPGQPGTGPSDMFTVDYVNKYATGDVYQNGMALALSKATYAGQVMSDYIVRFIFYEIYLTGDPDICVSNSAISTLAVDYPESVPGGGQTYAVTVTSAGRGPIEGALVCCYKETETHASGLTDASGSVSLHIAPGTQGTMHLTVTYFNGKTFEADVQVTSDATGVNLISFEGNRTREGAQLNWRVTNDSEAAVSFNLYRRESSKTASVSSTATAPTSTSKGDLAGWTLVNSSPIIGRNPYTYLDREVGKGKYEYALVAITNGKHGALGNTNLPAATMAFSLNIAPNPVRSMANVMVSMASPGTVQMKFYDLAGRVVKTTTLNLSAGENTASLNLSGLAEGIYVVQAENAGSILSRKIVVAR